MSHGPFGRAAERAGIVFDDEITEALEAFVALLSKHGARANLVGTTERARIADEIVMDSVRMAPLLTQAVGKSGRFVDIGAGAGIPTIPLLLAMPGWHGTAVEPREKRRTFMSFARRELGLRDRFVIADGRLEDTGTLVSDPHVELGFDAALSKAVLEPEEWIRRAQPLLHPRGMVGVWLGESSQLERSPTHAADYETESGSRRSVALVAR